MRDYYEILGVARDADADAVKKAYRRLALEHHPDRNNGSKAAEERFKEATEAYEVLRDPERRSAYDRFGHAGVTAGAGAGGGFSGFDFADALSVFMRDFGGFGVEDLFGGGGRRRSGRPRGSDLRVRVPLTLVDVANGTKKTVKLRVHEPCSECEGSGAARGTAPVACDTCGGAGEVRRVQRSILGQLVSVTPCPSCGGEGQRIAEACKQCGGRGVDSREKKVEVEVPPGVSTGDYITLRGQGNAGQRGGARGDVVVVLEVEDDPRFVREGPDLLHELFVTFTQAALGAEVEVPTVTGTAAVKIGAGTQSGHMLRMRGKGLPQLRGGSRGDLIVRVNVWTPTDLSDEQERLLRQLAAIESDLPAEPRQEHDRGLWSKIKEAFGGG
ncbi:MAG TPA: molecular chaperone DnaJ [Longimicrobiales bacterium]|nr:molecular chaperone DnaJ [Longimicrobiales bacterium]